MWDTWCCRLLHLFWHPQMFVPLLAWNICIFTPWFHQSLIIYYVLFTLVILFRLYRWWEVWWRCSRSMVAGFGFWLISVWNYLKFGKSYVSITTLSYPISFDKERFPKHLEGTSSFNFSIVHARTQELKSSRALMISGWEKFNSRIWI